MPRRTIGWFFLKVVIIYGLFILPWLHGADAYGWVYRKVATVVFREFGGAGRVYFGPIAHENPLHDTTVTIANLRVPGATGDFDINTRDMGYLPTAFLIALILASPVPWKRRLWALLLGLALITVFVWFRTYLRLVDAFSDQNVLAIYDLGRFWKGAVVVFRKILSRTPVTTYIAPSFIWILVTFRRGDIARIAGQSAPEPAEEAAAKRRLARSG